MGCYVSTLSDSDDWQAVELHVCADVRLFRTRNQVSGEGRGEAIGAAMVRHGRLWSAAEAGGENEGIATAAVLNTQVTVAVPCREMPICAAASFPRHRGTALMGALG